MQFLLLSYCYLSLLSSYAHSSSVTIDIYYPESNITLSEAANNNIFSIGYSSHDYSLDLVTDAEADGSMYFPWFGDFTTYVNNETHRIEPNHWIIGE
jgi:hypothetical protein